MILRQFFKQRTAKQFHYMPRYGDDKKFNMIYRTIGNMVYAESYASKRADKGKIRSTNLNTESENSSEETTEKRIQFQRSHRHQYNSSKMLLLILGGLIILVLALFGFDLTFFID